MTTDAPENDEKSNGGAISQFFRPKSKPVVYTGVNPSRAKENMDNIVVLDDDSDDDLDKKTIGIVDLTASPEPKEHRGEESEAVNDDGDEQQTSLAQKNAVPSSSVDDVVPEETRKRKALDVLCGSGEESTDATKPSSTSEDQIPSPEKPSTPPKMKENPFAKFAFGASSALESRLGNSTSATWQQHSSLTRTTKKAGSKADQSDENDSAPKKNHACSKDEKKKEKEFVKMKDHPPEVQERVTRKWHSMADPSASLEDRRYQILLAARLHARCQEPTVRKAIQKLREHFESRSKTTITVDEMAKSDPEDLAVHISSLQFYNVKAKQIVKAAQEIQSQHGGIVPEDELSLLQITGIGKTFADLLAFVNTREAHERLVAQSHYV